MKKFQKLISLLILLLVITNVNAFSIKEIFDSEDSFFIKLFNGIFKGNIKGINLNSYKNGLDEIPYLDGWPIYLGNIEGISSAVVGDINNDGYNEVVFGSPGPLQNGGMITVYYYNGTIVSGFPFYINTPIFSSPAIADINNNGFLDIIFNDQFENIYVIDYQGNLLPGWPQPTTNIDNHQLAITVDDIDNDGYMEIITPAHVLTSLNKPDSLYVFEHNGSIKQNFPVEVNGRIMYSSPAIADLDNDGHKEIIVASYGGYSSFESNNNSILVFEHNGSIKRNFPVMLDKNILNSEILSSPIVADINNDGNKEIIIGTRGNKVYVIDSNGRFLYNWPQETIGFIDNSPAVGDINHDGYLEIFVGAGTTIYGWNYEGIDLPDFPISNNGPLIYSSPVIGDINGDNNFEILIGSFNHNLYAWHSDGSIVDDFPIEIDNEIAATLTLDDINNDGNIEGILSSKGGWIYIWAFEGSPSNIEWPMFQNNIQHTGLYNQYNQGLNHTTIPINYNVSR